MLPKYTYLALPATYLGNEFTKVIPNYFFGEMRNIFQFCCLVCFYINAKLTDFCLNCNQTAT